jgi:hypothetical protein
MRAKDGNALHLSWPSPPFLQLLMPAFCMSVPTARTVVKRVARVGNFILKILVLVGWWLFVICDL